MRTSTPRRPEQRARPPFGLIACGVLLFPLWFSQGCAYQRDPTPELISRTEVPVATVPQRTLEAFRRDFPQVNITSVEHQVAREGSLLYQFEFVIGEKDATAVYDVDGTLLSKSL